MERMAPVTEPISKDSAGHKCPHQHPFEVLCGDDNNDSARLEVSHGNESPYRERHGDSYCHAWIHAMACRSIYLQSFSTGDTGILMGAGNISTRLAVSEEPTKRFPDLSTGGGSGHPRWYQN